MVPLATVMVRMVLLAGCHGTQIILMAMTYISFAHPPQVGQLPAPVASCGESLSSQFVSSSARTAWFLLVSFIHIGERQGCDGTRTEEEGKGDQAGGERQLRAGRQLHCINDIVFSGF
jgi:hypothetical protein